MKYVIVQGDGMSDYPVDELGGKTPLEYARTPNMDRLAAGGLLGLVRTIPDGFPAGTDVGTMSILGYDPARYHTGRSPIEAASMGIDLGDRDVAFRCNLVTLAGNSGREVMDDFTAGHVSTEEAKEIIDSIQAELGSEEIEFHAGVSYRHVMVWHGGPTALETVPPHDITGQAVAEYRPRGDGAERLAEISKRAREVIADHPVNRRRAERGDKLVTDVWLWGQGKRPAMPTLGERFGIRGGVITAVDVVGGLGRLAGLDRIDVPGVTGFVDTNYEGKGSYAVDALAERDLVFVHVEAPDESGHMGDAQLKVRAIEDLDEKVIGTILSGLEGCGPYRIMVLPDHATPVSVRTHTPDPVPFAIFDSRDSGGSGLSYDERQAASTGEMLPRGHELMALFLEKDGRSG
ncbi:MAG: cofactor-independent phosphoglycerate mutase [Deltaproteobacteria bacterium]|nr:MAG: cofactor-independent phosphoglycerate mutase [Deltaproteobacteria bacterium]